MFNPEGGPRDPEEEKPSIPENDTNKVSQETGTFNDSELEREPVDVFTPEAKETMEKENKIRGSLERVLKEVFPEIQERASHFNLEPSVAEDIEDDLMESFDESMSKIGRSYGRETIFEEANIYINKNIKIGKGEIIRKKLEESLSSEEKIVDLIDRKLKGEIDTEEKEVLSILSKEKKGTYDPATGKIEAPLFSSANLDEYKEIISHEFTHKGLNNFVPEKVKEAAIINIRSETFRTEIYSSEGKKIEMSAEEKNQKFFFMILTAIEEASAYRIEKYYGRKESPEYKGYRDKTAPDILKEIYNKIGVKTEKMSLEEIDAFSVDLYKNTAELWKEDLSEDDLKMIAGFVKSKIAKP